jgi:hypothetical protein
VRAAQRHRRREAGWAAADDDGAKHAAKNQVMELREFSIKLLERPPVHQFYHETINGEHRSDL